MKKLGIIGIVATLIFGAGYVIFDRLGGSNTIEINLIEQSPDRLSGKTFRGTPQDKSLGETFQSIERQKFLHPGAKIHTIYFIEPAGKLDTMHVFVGLNIPFPSVEWESKTFPESRFLLAKIKANKWVMPGPNKVKSKLEDYAQKHQLKLSGLFIDKIVSDEEVHVIAPVN